MRSKSSSKTYTRCKFLRALFGPFQTGEYVVSWSTFGLVFRSGPKQFSVVWQSGQVTRHQHDYRGFQRVTCSGSWNYDPVYEARVKSELHKELQKMLSYRLNRRPL